MNRLENLKRKSKILLYNNGLVVPNNTISEHLEQDWKYLAFAIGTSSGSDRISFITMFIFGNNNEYIQF